MSNKLTIVKVLSKHGEYHVSEEDLERWRQKFADNEEAALLEGTISGEIAVESLAEKVEGEHYLTIVKVGDETYMPTLKELDNWREVFEDAAKDPDFKIFTHPAVEIQVIPIGKVVGVE